MSITLTPFNDGNFCHGYTWSIDDEDLLADQIACVALGQSRHVQKILAGANLGDAPTTENCASAAIELLTVHGGDPWHRDGWMFQVISWIAAYRATPEGIIRAPHMILADKGFDGLQLELDEAGETVIAAIIFEDKATVNPRKVIREEVWPEFEAYDFGEEENMLVAEVVSLLEKQNGLDSDEAIQNILWKEARKFRVSITIGNIHTGTRGRERLFRDYKVTISGNVNRRRAETIYIENLRVWMAALADKAINAVNEKVAAHV